MKAKVTYRLNEAGRKASLVAGGDGKQDQSVEIEVTPSDLDLFNADSSGALARDMQHGSELKDYGYENWDAHYFDHPPEQAEIINFLRDRENQRAIALAAKAAKDEEVKLAKEKEDQAKRTANIAALRAALAEARICLENLREGDRFSYDSSDILISTDPDCGSEVAEMFARKEAADKRDSDRQARMKELNGIAKSAQIRPTTPTADGNYKFECPSSGMSEKDWAKHIESIDSTQNNGYAFQGAWLKPGSSYALPLGDLIVVGGSENVGSRRHPEFKHKRDIFVVTPAGLRRCGSNAATAQEYLALSPSERVEKICTAAIGTCDKTVSALDALDRTEFAEELDKIAERRASWAELKALCEKALATETTEAAIDSIDAAARAIIMAGYRALAKQHHPDAGGSAESMAHLSAAKSQLLEILKLAKVAA